MAKIEKGEELPHMNSTTCPLCLDDNISVSSLDLEDGDEVVHATCHDCGSKWEIQIMITGVKIIEDNSS